jgi:hypothetical protein
LPRCGSAYSSILHGTYFQDWWKKARTTTADSQVSFSVIST